MRYAAEYFATARERERIRRRRAAGKPAPWTTNLVFRDWRFCNVRREDDVTTAWFREHVRSRARGAQVVFATVAFRWFNLIATGEKLRDLLVGAWDGEEARRRLLASEGEEQGQLFTGAYRVAAPHARSQVITGAYVIKTPDGMTKMDGVLWCVEEARWRLPTLLADRSFGSSLAGAWESLTTLPYVGGFMAYEVVSDLRWTDVLGGAQDILTWANAGPGCRRGLGWVVAGDPEHFGQGVAARAEMLEVMRELLAMSQRDVYWPSRWQPWEMREVEHWSCEFDKYNRARRGERLKRRFKFGEGGAA